MRGVAALVIVFWHSGALGPLQPGAGYLSVDLFFLLSGFVLAYTYDPRFARGLSAIGFLRRRLLRLLPLHLAGLGVGLLVARLPGAMTFAWLRVLAPSQVPNALILPAIVIGRAGVLFPTNNVLWSLFFEFWVGNLLYALTWRWLRDRALVAFVAVSAILILWCEWRYGKLDVGIESATILGGGVRILFGFFAGVLLFRTWAGHPPRVAVPAWLLLATLVAALWLPSSGVLARARELACVFFLFPLLVYLGTGATERRPSVGRTLGNASYAVYALHWPLVVAAMLAIERYRVQPSLALQVGFEGAVALLGVVAEIAYDRPVGRLLRKLSAARGG